MAGPVKFLPYHLRHKRQGLPRHGVAREASGLTLRGVVLNVFEPGDPRLTGVVSPEEQLAGPGVLCDVLIYDHPYRTILRGVPVMTQSSGLNDYTVWKPRAATIDLMTGVLSVSPELPATPSTFPSGTPPSAAHNMDGDHVIVQFLANDMNQPIIVGQIPHPKTFRKPLFANPIKFKYQRYLRGSTFGMTDGGNVEINMSLASTGVVGAGGIEVPSPGLYPALAGNLTITMATGALPVSAKVRIVDAIVSAPEPVILGSTFLTALTAALTEIQTAFIGLGLPTVNIAALIAGITASQAAGLPYLSSHLEVD